MEVGICFSHRRLPHRCYSRLAPNILENPLWVWSESPEDMDTSIDFSLGREGRVDLRLGDDVLGFHFQTQQKKSWQMEEHRLGCPNSLGFSGP